jgi:hypothetical protein
MIGSTGIGALPAMLILAGAGGFGYAATARCGGSPGFNERSRHFVHQQE